MHPSPSPSTAVAPDLTPEHPCVSCGTPLAGNYCHVCGEKQLNRHDYQLTHFLEHTVDAVSHLDLRVLRDLWAQLRRPGLVAADWLQGRRVKHAPPVQLFLVTNLLFYVLATASHFSPFESRLQYHLGTPVYGAWARQLVQEYLTRSNTSMEAFAARFAESAHVYSKSLVFLFVPLLAAPLWLLFRRQRRYFVEWLSLNLYLFGGILLLFASISLVMLGVHQVPPLARLVERDSIIMPFMFGLTTTYAALFFRRAFPNQSRGRRVAKAVLYTVSFLLCLLFLYRLALFVACYWTVT